ncbi:linker histone H1 and H5 family-domain-containing protein [Aspergillus coremiiformis]|uniref:Histone H1 n=1 Tax=Aspergillus coremiiformis TaxID=138285 RepID=A0A5N6YXQ5_9EURO|nr:linker histone H1 and H5 family-domain-containing protein [Aspergillus coremiiformis]
MPPKKASAGTAKKTSSTHASYRDMIKDAILNLKERNGSSRQSIKKYVLANNKIAPASNNSFDSQFNKAIKAGVEKGEFTQPKGPSGPVKLAKKEAAAKPAAKKSTTATKAKKTTATSTTKKAEKAEKAEKPKTTTKKTGTTTKRSVGRPKANTAKPRKASTTAPAVVDQPKVIGKTKSGRVTKTTAKPAEKATKKSTKKA